MADTDKNAINTYSGDGSRTSFLIDFPYLNKADVKVRLDAVLQDLPDDYDFDSGGTSIVFVTAPPNTPANNVVFTRITGHPVPDVTFSDSSPVTADDLDRTARQSMYYTEEVEDKI